MNAQLADSRQVAEYLGKPHDFLLKKIKSAKCSKAFRQENFWQLKYSVANKKPQPMFLLTYNGFFLLVSTGFGKKSEYWRKKIFRLITQWESSLENYINVEQKENNGKPYVEALLEHGEKLYKAGREIAEKKNKKKASEKAANAMILPKCKENKATNKTISAESAIDADWEEVREENQSQNLTKRERNRLAGRRYRWNKKLVALGLPRIERGKTDLPETFQEYLAIFGDENPYSNAESVFKTIIKEEVEEFGFTTTKTLLDNCNADIPKECLYDFKRIALKCLREAGLIYRRFTQRGENFSVWAMKNDC